MSDWEKIIYTACTTILVGSLVYIVTQILSKRVIEPINEMQKLLSNVKFNLSYFAPIIFTPISRNEERSTEAANALRKSSADLIATVDLLPKNRLVIAACCVSIPNSKDIIKASNELRVLSTYLHDEGEVAINAIEEIISRKRKIFALLNMQDDEDI